VLGCADDVNIVDKVQSTRRYLILQRSSISGTRDLYSIIGKFNNGFDRRA